jgi:hypothetical protein
VKATPELESKIAASITEFDPVALLVLLRALGYGTDEVIFQSKAGAVSHGSLLQAIEFRKQPKQAVVTVGIGLLGPQSPLPTYFTQLLSGEKIDEHLFLDFLRFFDHKIIEGYIQATHPESDPAVFRDWDGVKKGYLGLLGIRSIATLQWLLCLVFPELEVEVRRGGLKRWMQVNATRLNYSKMGPGSCLGGWAQIPVPGFEVRVTSDEEYTEHGYPWAEEVRRRLFATAFPAIWDAAVDVNTTLIIRSEKVWAQLRPGSYLGFDRCKGGPMKNREIHVWRGLVTEESVAAAAKRLAIRSRAPRAERVPAEPVASEPAPSEPATSEMTA